MQNPGFNTQPPEGGCLAGYVVKGLNATVSTHSRPKAAASDPLSFINRSIVSTHSRPKAAAPRIVSAMMLPPCFNTQPPEGGCSSRKKLKNLCDRFNTQPPEGGCINCSKKTLSMALFQHTAARRRLRKLLLNSHRLELCFNTQPPEGGCHFGMFEMVKKVGFNTQPPEGGCCLGSVSFCIDFVSTHSRPKAAAQTIFAVVMVDGGFNTQPPEGGCEFTQTEWGMVQKFQHTAARRRLQYKNAINGLPVAVSTHSRPKAAAIFFIGIVSH